jgi:glycosyltransferase involved in cell wall biosynthesis
MRIALASWESLHSVAVGGVAVHVSELARAMEGDGHEVHVFTRQGPGQSEDECIENVWYHRVPFDPFPDFVDGIYQMCHAMVRRYAETQRIAGPFDLFHAHDWLAVAAMLEVKHRFGTPTVLTMHSTEFGRCGNHFYDGPSARVRHLERRGVTEADRVIAVSRTLQRELAWAFETPAEAIGVIYNGIRPSIPESLAEAGGVRQRYSIPREQPMVLFAGRMTCQKGPDLLVGAVPDVLRHHPGAQFVFAGDGDLRHRLEGEAWHRGIAHACRFLGHRSAREMKDLFAASDMVVVPSRNEPFGIVILEAWDASRPVVATENGGPSEFVWHEVTGLKIKDREASIAWGVNRLLNSPGWAAWMGRNGRVAVETAFSWASIALKTEQAYLDLVRPRSSEGIPHRAIA